MRFGLYTGWTKRIWTILWGCLEVTGWLKIKNFNSSKKFMQISLKVNKVYSFDIKHGLTMNFWFFFPKIETMVTKFSEKFVIIMLKKHRKFCRCGLTHLDATPTFKNCPNTYGPPYNTKKICFSKIKKISFSLQKILEITYCWKY